MNGRRWLGRSLTLAGVLAAMLGASASPAGAQARQVKLVGQQAGMWCWAAVGQMAMSFLDPPSGASPYLQHLLAQRVLDPDGSGLGTISCASACPAASPECNQGAIPPLHPSFGYGFQSTVARGRAEDGHQGPLNPEQLAVEFGACRPIAFAWCLTGSCHQDDPSNGIWQGWQANGAVRGHFRLGVGLETQTVNGVSALSLRVIDPEPACTGTGPTWMPLAEYSKPPDTSKQHWRTYYEIEKCCTGHCGGSCPAATCQLPCPAPEGTCGFPTLEPDELDVPLTVPSFRAETGDASEAAKAIVQALNRSTLIWLQGDNVLPAFDGAGQLAADSALDRFVVSTDRSGVEWTEGRVKLWGRRLFDSARAIKQTTYVVKAQGSPIANVVLRQLDNGTFELVSVEGGARAQAIEGARSKKPQEDTVEVVVPDLGLSVLMSRKDLVNPSAETRVVPTHRLPAGPEATELSLGAILGSLFSEAETNWQDF